MRRDSIVRRALAAALAAGALAATPAAAATPGELTELGAANGPGTTDARAVAISPDGANAYVVARSANAVGVLDRNPVTGALTERAGTAGCISATGSGGACATGRALTFPRAVAVSPDGRSVYVAANGAIAVLDRDPATGALTQKAGTDGCVSQDGSGGTCGVAAAVSIPVALAVSPDGMSVYAIDAALDAIVVLDRDQATGALTQKPGAAGCLSANPATGCVVDPRLVVPHSLAVTPDGTSVYVGGEAMVAGFDRNPLDGALAPMPGERGCVAASALRGLTCLAATGLTASVTGVAVSPDGTSLYAAVSPDNTRGAVVTLPRDPASGLLTTLAGNQGCLSVVIAGCQAGRVVNDATSLAVSPDGDSLYVAVGTPAGVAVLDRDPRSGALTQKAGQAGCLGPVNGCAPGAGMSRAMGLAVSPDGGNVYVAANDDNEVVALKREALPVCRDVRAAAFAATARTVALSCSDANGDPLALTIVTPPAHGTLGAVDQAAGSVAYTPATGFSGLDSFRYRATSAGSDSNVATAVLDVLPAGATGPQGQTGPAGATTVLAAPLFVGLAAAKASARRGHAFALRYVATGPGRATLTILRGSRRVASATGRAKAGRNTIAVSGRTARKLKRGAYRLRLVLTGTDGRTATDTGRLTIR